MIYFPLNLRQDFGISNQVTLLMVGPNRMAPFIRNDSTYFSAAKRSVSQNLLPEK